LAGIASLQDERRTQGAPTLPVVLDDVLMAFDDNRARAALNLMVELAQQWQIIVMTHHEHLVGLIKALPADIVTVTTLAGLDAIASGATPQEVRAQAQRVTTRVEAAATAEPRAGSGTDPSLVRAWAKDNGHEVADRGRIPAHLTEAYDRAHG